MEENEGRESAEAPNEDYVHEELELTKGRSPDYLWGELAGTVEGRGRWIPSIEDRRRLIVADCRMITELISELSHDPDPAETQGLLTHVIQKQSRGPHEFRALAKALKRWTDREE